VLEASASLTVARTVARQHRTEQVNVELDALGTLP
jgi:hypothetical protein